MNSYDLSRCFWDFAFENPDKIKPNHIAVYFFAIEHCNRLGWKEKFGLPTTMVMESTGIKSYNTYSKTLKDLVDFGFIKMIEKSKNQYSSNIVALSKFDKALNKALDKAFIKHISKQDESTIQSIDSINKPINKETNKQRNQQTTNLLGVYEDFYKELLKFFSIVSEHHQRNVFGYLVRKINENQIKDFYEQTKAMMKWKRENLTEKRSNWNNYTYEYDKGSSTDWIGKLKTLAQDQKSTETDKFYNKIPMV